MTDWIIWLVLAGVMVILEILTGTFYLLMIGIGLAAGGLVALAGGNVSMQFTAAAIVGVLATFLLRRSGYGKMNKTDAASDPNVNLDVGQLLKIEKWRHDSGQHAARAMYRGAMWDVELAHDAVAQPGLFVIREVRGSRLIVANHTDNN